ncbi:type II toxin-antitoxin system RelB/DinJ family antitoxin [Anaerococcus sp. mt242]|uniref:type II toxin-antitoxin system RelB/DinJ family antitoxin n=1 Tax=Anaerococcus sp. mt242 TaxID=2661917 RepID=UPI0019318F72|nr:type II toxin-antitoxin system RelB/DinJ family antitoxin [Anaerococcus sp. mt242]MBM0046689.1 type II toxin-antitoxin system RelB/DinJ family antitoxin [Anaerococcus sp. mt242]
MDSIKEARVSARIDQETKNKAEKELSKHGLSISEFIRMNLTTVANQGLPDYYGIPNEETMAAIYEMVETLNSNSKMEPISFEEINNLFNE